MRLLESSARAHSVLSLDDGWAVNPSEGIQSINTRTKLQWHFGHRTDYLFAVGCKVDGTIVGDSKQNLFVGSKKMPLEWLLLKIPWLLLISPTNLDSYCNRLVLYTLNWVAHLYSASFSGSKIFHFCKRGNSAAKSGMLIVGGAQQNYRSTLNSFNWTWLD